MVYIGALKQSLMRRLKKNLKNRATPLRFPVTNLALSEIFSPIKTLEKQLYFGAGVAWFQTGLGCRNEKHKLMGSLSFQRVFVSEQTT